MPIVIENICTGGNHASIYSEEYELEGVYFDTFFNSTEENFLVHYPSYWISIREELLSYESNSWTHLKGLLE